MQGMSPIGRGIALVVLTWILAGGIYELIVNGVQ